MYRVSISTALNKTHDPVGQASVSTLKEISRIPGNPDRSRVIFGKLKNSRKFKNMENVCKHVEKYYFYGLKKHIFLARSHKPIS